ncbi:hypothetical protein E3U43_011414 [Larimichthys crocea]|uniref:Uncharacterized protein n=1 Tax=Larimichthys crocea TaxID=215358 RepID=A0ACD3QKS2_LARCR|nr:hypothetical protein E3U43_011414 [Larimichthys crocea]
MTAPLGLTVCQVMVSVPVQQDITCLGGGVEGILPCPPGTYSPQFGLSQVEQCLICPAGHYCEKERLTKVSGKCKAGWFCVSAAWNSQPFDLDNYTNANCLCPATSTGGRCQVWLCRWVPAPPGFTVSEELLRPDQQMEKQAASVHLGHTVGSAAPEPCPSGTFQSREKQSSCNSCEAGTVLPNQYPCPIGSFNQRPLTHSLAGCVPCAAGQYCPSVGLAEPAGPCQAGYWCREGASSPSPVDGLSGSLCPPGQYCPSGTTAPVPCPEGSWSNSSGLGMQDDCKPCLGGFYCDSAGLTKPSGPCSRGYYCVEGATTSTPTDGITGGPCPEGSYCPKGAVRPVPCDPGTYVAVTHATQCEPCLPGWYCVSGSLYLCPAGFYCPEGTGFDLRGCPEGTYGPDPGYWSVSQCRQCDGGHYCSSRNGTAITGPCQGGYYCSHGNKSPQPFSQAAGEGGPCPAGHYCPEATVHPLPCPPGTFSNLTKLVSQEDCQPCLPGYYCDAVGLSAPSGKCWKGFFCLEGANRPDPPLRDSRGGPCPKGSFCASPGKSVASGQCGAGYYCLSGARSPTPDDGGMTGDRCPEEGSLSLLIPVQLAPTVQVEKTAVSRLYPAHLETCAHLDLKNWYPAFQGATRIYLDR